ncbi:MAG: AmmeMemoRadiSam system protein A [Halothiobacillaceae bacterium]
MPSTDRSEESLDQLPALARAAIGARLADRQVTAESLLPENPPTRWQDPGASFVTLHKQDRLRGCIGSLEARRPLGLDVIHNAFDAAFRDPRFPPLMAEELPQLSLLVSVLGPMTPMAIQDAAELRQQLTPGRDGLVIATPDGASQATFLPSVWQQLPEPENFVGQLLRKAGLPADYSGPLKAWRYPVTEHHEAAQPEAGQDPAT